MTIDKSWAFTVNATTDSYTVEGASPVEIATTSSAYTMEFRQKTEHKASFLSNNVDTADAHYGGQQRRRR